jgi:hypothetical protein
VAQPTKHEAATALRCTSVVQTTNSQHDPERVRPPEMQQPFSQIEGTQAAMNAFVSINAGNVSPAEFLDRNPSACCLPLRALRLATATARLADPDRNVQLPDDRRLHESPSTR